MVRLEKLLIKKETKDLFGRIVRLSLQGPMIHLFQATLLSTQ
jgi:hypothetical protein